MRDVQSCGCSYTVRSTGYQTPQVTAGRPPAGTHTYTYVGIKQKKKVYQIFKIYLLVARVYLFAGKLIKTVANNAFF